MDSAPPLGLMLDEELPVELTPRLANNGILSRRHTPSIDTAEAGNPSANKKFPLESEVWDLTTETSGSSDYQFAMWLQHELTGEALAAKRVAEDADLALAISLSEKRARFTDCTQPIEIIDHEKLTLKCANSGTNISASSDYVLALRLSKQQAPKKDYIQSLGGKIHCLTHACYHLPNFLPLHLQQELYLVFERDALLTDPDSPYQQVWDHKKCAGEDVKPSQLLAFDIGQRAMAYVSHCTAESLWGESVHLDCCSTTGYNKEGRLLMHVDWGGVGGWVVLLSLGANAEFCFGNSCMNKARRCTLSSGDVLILQGSKVYHGIERVWGDVPPFWKLQFTRRLAVQMRDHRQNVPGWDKNGIIGQL